MNVQDLDIPPNIVEEFLEEGINTLNPPQKDAVQQGLLEGEDIVVASPTASGKTLIAELALSKKTVEKDGKTVYIVPLKALASEKYQDFKERYTDQDVRIAIGDYDDSGESLETADIIIATSEKLDSIMRHNPAWISTIDLVVVDEIHLLNSTSRGPTLEVTITKLRDTIDFQLLGLSATISNAESMSDWLNAQHVQSDYRPVELEQAVAFEDSLEFYRADEEGEANIKDGFSKASEHNTDLKPFKKQDLDGESSNTPVRVVEDTMDRDKQSIIFCSSRKGAEKSSDRNSEPTKNSIGRNESQELSEYADRIENSLGNPTAQCRRLAENVEKGSAFHHAGLCLAEDSVIMHPDGTFSTVKELYQNQKSQVIGLDDNSLEETKINDKYKMDSKPVLKVLTEKGKSVEVTPNHKLPVQTGGEITWTKACDLNEGDKIGVAGSVKTRSLERPGIQITQDENTNTVELTHEFLEKLGVAAHYLTSDSLEGQSMGPTQESEGPLGELRSESVKIGLIGENESLMNLGENRKTVCEKLGLPREDDEEVRMPGLQLPETYLKSYLAGFLEAETEGNENGNSKIEISFDNTKFLNEIQLSLLRLEIESGTEGTVNNLVLNEEDAETILQNNENQGEKDSNQSCIQESQDMGEVSWERIARIENNGIRQLYDISTGTENFLANSIICHNTTEQRNLVEEAFEKGLIKTVSATPTLAAGVNLPAFRVVIRDLKRYTGEGMDWIPVLEYNQMTGRAGRPGYDDRGEAIAIAKNRGQINEVVERYITGESEKIRSKLASEPVLRMHTLSLIASKYCSDMDQIYGFFKKTFYAHQFGNFSEIKSKIDKTVQDLRDYGFVEGESIRATKTGKRVAELYIDPDSAHHMIESMETAQRTDTRPISYLYMISRTSEMAPRPNVKNSEASEMERSLQDARTYLLENIPEEWNPSYEIHLESMKLALTMRAWINEVDEEKIMQKFDMAPGGIRSKNRNADWLLYSAQELSDLENLGQRESLEKLRRRIRHGIKEELLSLVKYDQIGRVRARKLYKHGVDTRQMIRETNFEKLKKLIGDSTARKLKEQVGEENIFDRENITDYFD